MNPALILSLLFLYPVHIQCRPRAHQHHSHDHHSHAGPHGENHSYERHSYEHRDPLLIETKSGPVRGYSKEVLGREVHIFTGIPFAKPPLGNLRFKKPVPIGRWPGFIDATKLPNSCYQEKYEYFPGFEGEEMWNPNTNLSEDCLYLNIWAPQRLRIRHKTGEHDTKRQLAPVLVWIYGGGYMSGTATLDIYNADIVAGTSDVIVVSIQYRVGAFGFLYLKGLLPDHFEDAPGNMGLWDQIMAFEWLRDNIEFFGGNPDLITLFGESAGAASVSLLPDHFEDAPGNMGLWDQIMAFEWLRDNIEFFGGNPDLITLFGESAGAASVSLLPDHFEDAPGNMGLWDQIMAFEWLRDNIEFFGGNPDLITLFGESAGAASVSIHLLSPLTRHLFKRGIMQSGTLNAPWSYMTAERAVEIARKLLDDVGCNGTTNLEDNPERVMSCLGAVDSKTISSMQWNSYTAILGFTSAPTIDGELVPKHPLAMIEDMSKDDNLTEIIIGSNQDEDLH
ncbi:acetylcholinesterase-like [Diaphorina citri]|uniref:Carboxylic ester hydrolase n=1 Tax=Diaphorina citri TaxID=121845 RepID=A0A3Q0JA33_DIACI|nr:acetylcholinesterase-like [Diaphorina citri]